VFVFDQRQGVLKEAQDLVVLDVGQRSMRCPALRCGNGVVRLGLRLEFDETVHSFLVRPLHLESCRIFACGLSPSIEIP
jgi:hypothetical protein